MNRRMKFLLPGALALALAGCGDSAKLPEDATVGAEPDPAGAQQNADPDRQHRARQGLARRREAEGGARLAVNAFATGLDHPRWLYVLPNGDVLVAETNAPPRPEEGKGIKGMVMQFVMKRAGAGVPSANRITLLRDADGDGVAEIAHRIPRRI